MTISSRRTFLGSSLGVLTTSGWGLDAHAQLTLRSGTLSEEEQLVFFMEEPKSALLPVDCKATEDTILGPCYRPGSPFQAQITPPLKPRNVMVIARRVWAIDTRKPLRSTVIDIWHANAKGRYDNDFPKKTAQSWGVDQPCSRPYGCRRVLRIRTHSPWSLSDRRECVALQPDQFSRPASGISAVEHTALFQGRQVQRDRCVHQGIFDCCTRRVQGERSEHRAWTL